MTRSTRRTYRGGVSLAAATAACWLFAPSPARADWVQTAAGTYEYNDTNNWAVATIDDLFPSTLNVAGAQVLTFDADRALPGAWQFLYDGPGNLTLRGAAANQSVTLGGNVTLDSVTNARTVTIGSATVDQNLNVNLGAASRTFTVATGDRMSLPNVLSGGTAAGTLAILKQGGGTLSLGLLTPATVNTFTGNIQIDGGVFEALQNEGAGTANAVLGNVNNDVILNGGTLRLNFTHTANGRFASGRTLTVNAGAGNFLDTPTRVNFGTVGQLVAGSTAVLTKTGIGDLNLFAANNGFVGTLNVQQGNLAIRVTNALPAAARINLTGGNLGFNVGAATVSAPVTITANTTLSDGAGTDGPGVLHVLGNLTVGAHTVTHNNNTNSTSGTQTLRFAGTHTLTGSPTFTVNSSNGAIQLMEISGPLGQTGGAFGLTKLGSGQLSLTGTGANTFTGNVAVNAGTLVLGKPTAIPAAATLTMGGGNVTFANSPTNPIANTGAMVNVASGFLGATGVGGAGSSTVTQTLAGLNVSGSGNFSSGVNSAWTIGTGTFTAGSSYVGNSASVTTFDALSLTGLSATTAGVTGGQANAFVLTGNSATTKAVVAVGGGGLTLSGSNVVLRRSTTVEVTGDGGSKLVLAGDVTTTGAAGSAILEDTAYTGVTATSRGTIGVDLNAAATPASRTFAVGGTAPLTVSVPINDGAGPASLVKTGAGEMTLSAANAYTGTTTVSQGTLNVAAGGTLGGGNVGVLGSAQSLSLLSGVIDAIPDDVVLTLAGGGTGGTADAGFALLASDVNESVGGLILGGVTQTQPGTYGSLASAATFKNDEYFGGTGVVTLVPEPTTAGLLGLAAAGLLARRRRRVG